MRSHGRFEWDPKKAQENLRKHGVSFAEAAKVLADEDGHQYHVEEFDDAHSTNEPRWSTLGSHPEDRARVLHIVWTLRDRGEVTRIISVRSASRQERKSYAEEVAKR